MPGKIKYLTKKPSPDLSDLELVKVKVYVEYMKKLDLLTHENILEWINTAYSTLSWSKMSGGETDPIDLTRDELQDLVEYLDYLTQLKTAEKRDTLKI